ncbi:MAG: phytoene/squalene synthase family protein [Pirellulales bacterium]
MNASGAASASASPRLAASYDACRRLARQAASSFYWTFWLLPRAQRQAMLALYAFARHTDDLADDAGEDVALAARAAALQRWRSAWYATLAATPDAAIPAIRDGDQAAPATDLPHSDLPCGDILPALADAARRFAIPRQPFDDLLDGVERDLSACDFSDLNELRKYCQQVASSIGIACLHIWTERPRSAYDAATECGIAFQLTNILRDLREDAQRDRLYLPLEFVHQAGLSRSELCELLLQQRCDPRCFQLIEQLAAVAEDSYRLAWPLRTTLRGGARRCFELMFHTYHALLGDIRRAPQSILAGRVRLSRPRKAWLALRSLCGASPNFRAAPLPCTDVHQGIAP